MRRRKDKCHKKIAYPKEFIDEFARKYNQYKYHCGMCNYWHLTSNPDWHNKNNQGEIDAKI